MNISFGKGFIKIPSENKYINPDNILTITEYNDGTSIIMQDLISIGSIRATADEIAKSCTEAQSTGGVVEIKENFDKFA